MRIVLTGGGTGGHVSPIAAVAFELKRQRPEAQLHYVGQRGDPLRKLLAGESSIDAQHSVLSGKFRRYHGTAWWKQALDIPTVLLNLRDVFKVGIGLVQCIWLFARLRPAAVFLKGGDLSLPVGLAAALLRIPTVTHDSDVLPGMGNRIGGRWARIHAVGVADSPFYPYPKETIRVVGVPLRPGFEPVSPEKQRGYKRELGLPVDEPLIFVTGGGLGAWPLNQAVAAAAPPLLELGNLIIVTGDRTHDEARALLEGATGRYSLRVMPFVEKDMQIYTGAADVVITRNGATLVAELALQRKPAIVVPNPRLSEGHQLKNAELLESKRAARVITEAELAEDPRVLASAVEELLGDRGKELAANLAGLARPDAARDLAGFILEVAKHR